MDHLMILDSSLRYPHLKYAVATVDVATIGFKGKGCLNSNWMRTWIWKYKYVNNWILIRWIFIRWMRRLSERNYEALQTSPRQMAQSWLLDRVRPAFQAIKHSVTSASKQPQENSCKIKARIVTVGGRDLWVVGSTRLWNKREHVTHLKMSTIWEWNVAKELRSHCKVVSNFVHEIDLCLNMLLVIYKMSVQI